MLIRSSISCEETKRHLNLSINATRSSQQVAVDKLRSNINLADEEASETKSIRQRTERSIRSRMSNEEKKHAKERSLLSQMTLEERLLHEESLATNHNTPPKQKSFRINNNDEDEEDEDYFELYEHIDIRQSKKLAKIQQKKQKNLRILKRKQYLKQNLPNFMKKILNYFGIMNLTDYNIQNDIDIPELNDEIMNLLKSLQFSLADCNGILSLFLEMIVYHTLPSSSSTTNSTSSNNHSHHHGNHNIQNENSSRHIKSFHSIKKSTKNLNSFQALKRAANDAGNRVNYSSFIGYFGLEHDVYTRRLYDIFVAMSDRSDQIYPTKHTNNSESIHESSMTFRGFIRGIIYFLPVGKERLHEFSFRLLTRTCGSTGFKKEFAVLDSEDLLSFLYLRYPPPFDPSPINQTNSAESQLPLISSSISTKSQLPPISSPISSQLPPISPKSTKSIKFNPFSDDNTEIEENAKNMNVGYIFDSLQQDSMTSNDVNSSTFIRDGRMSFLWINEHFASPLVDYTPPKYVVLKAPLNQTREKQMRLRFATLMLRHLDIDGDGMISFEDFTQSMKKNTTFLSLFHPLLNHLRRCILGLDFWIRRPPQPPIESQQQLNLECLWIREELRDSVVDVSGEALTSSALPATLSEMLASYSYGLELVDGPLTYSGDDSLNGDDRSLMSRSQMSGEDIDKKAEPSYGVAPSATVGTIEKIHSQVLWSCYYPALLLDAYKTILKQNRPKQRFVDRLSRSIRVAAKPVVLDDASFSTPSADYSEYGGGFHTPMRRLSNATSVSAHNISSLLRTVTMRKRGSVDLDDISHFASMWENAAVSQGNNSAMSTPVNARAKRFFAEAENRSSRASFHHSAYSADASETEFSGRIVLPTNTRTRNQSISDVEHSRRSSRAITENPNVIMVTGSRRPSHIHNTAHVDDFDDSRSGLKSRQYTAHNSRRPSRRVASSSNDEIYPDDFSSLTSWIGEDPSHLSSVSHLQSGLWNHSTDATEVVNQRNLEFLRSVGLAGSWVRETISYLSTVAAESPTPLHRQHIAFHLPFSLSKNIRRTFFAEDFPEIIQLRREKRINKYIKLMNSQGTGDNTRKILERAIEVQIGQTIIRYYLRLAILRWFRAVGFERDPSKLATAQETIYSRILLASNHKFRQRRDEEFNKFLSDITHETVTNDTKYPLSTVYDPVLRYVEAIEHVEEIDYKNSYES